MQVTCKVDAKEPNAKVTDPYSFIEVSDAFLGCDVTLKVPCSHGVHIIVVDGRDLRKAIDNALHR